MTTTGQETMSAVVFDRYGPPEVLQVRTIPKATIAPNSRDILVKVHAVGVTKGDCRVRGSDVPYGFGILFRLAFGISGPRKNLLGADFAGTVAAVGSQVTRFKVGDRVIATNNAALGGYAEFVKVVEGNAVVLPESISFEEAATLPFGGATSLLFLRRANVQPGAKVLVYGASGAVGSAAVQHAKHQFNAHVTAVCSASNFDFVRSLGADVMIDYNVQDFTTNGEKYDVIVECVGKADFYKTIESLKPEGSLLLIAGTLPDMLRGAWTSMTSGKKVIGGPAEATAEVLQFLVDAIAQGKYRTVLDRQYTHDKIPEAHTYIEGGHRRGNVVATFP